MSARYVLLPMIVALTVGAVVFWVNPCLVGKNCEVSRSVFLISKSVEKRRFAKTALRVAEANFRVLFFLRPVPGVILLDKGISEPLAVRFRSRRRMRFDPIGPEALSDILAEEDFAIGAEFLISSATAAKAAEFGAPEEPLSAALGDQEFETAMHEICHVLFSNSMGGKQYSDAMDEIAAVSCETNVYLDLRTRDFRMISVGLDPVSWDEFLQMRHPLKRQEQFAKSLKAGVLRAKNSVGFALDSESELGRSVDLFYARAAVFALFWKKHCPGQNIMSDLAEHLSEEHKFSDWLMSHVAECVPNTILDFERSLAAMLQHA